MTRLQISPSPEPTGASIAWDRRCAMVATLLLALLAAAPSARALPRYSAQYGQSCVLCHADPAGGGMRTLYASQFLVPEEIAARGWREGELGESSTEISPGITVGADLRTLAYQVQGGAGSTLAMQGDLYLQAELGPRYAAYVEQGLGGGGAVFGIARYETLDSYVKTGRFAPDFGWRFADHQMFTRRYLVDPAGSDSPAGLYRSGAEAGISPGPLTASASLLGGDGSHGDNFATRAMVQRPVGPLNLGIGGSLLREQAGEGRRRAAGAFWYAAWGRHTWLGEFDETEAGGRTGLLVSHEVAFAMRRGYDLRLTYNFQDPDRDLRTGSRRRYGIGVAAMPTPFLSLLIAGNYWDLEPGPAVAGGDFVEGQVVVHWFY